MKFKSNVLETISNLKVRNSKNHFSILVLYLPAYSYTGTWKCIRNNLENKLRCNK